MTARSAFNVRMRTARGNRSLDVAWADARAIYPDIPSRSTIARLETDPVAEDKADPGLVAALARVYGTTVDDLSPVIAERSRRLVLVLVGAPDPTEPGGERPDGGDATPRYQHVGLDLPERDAA